MPKLRVWTYFYWIYLKYTRFLKLILDFYKICQTCIFCCTGMQASPPEPEDTDPKPPSSWGHQHWHGWLPASYLYPCINNLTLIIIATASKSLIYYVFWELILSLITYFLNIYLLNIYACHISYVRSWLDYAEERAEKL